MARARKILVAFAVVCALSGCGASPAVGHARSGDFPAVSKDLDAKAQSGELSDSAMRDVAKAVLEHDLEHMPAERGVERVLALEACAKPIEGALRKRSKGDDDVAAASAWLLVSAGLTEVDTWTDAHRDDPRPLFRAVAARGLVGKKEAKLRASRAIDDDQYVRRAAVLAAGDAGCATDFPILLDSARHDPSAIVRVDAIRSLVKIAPRLSGPGPRADLADRLDELWDGGDDSLRGAIARAWVSDDLFLAGGRAHLQTVLGRDEGHATVEAAAMLMRAGGDGAVILGRQAMDADPEVRAHALRMLELERPTHRKLLQDVAQNADDDASLRVVAAARLATVPELRQKAIEVLVSLLSRKDKVGTDAAIALGNEGDVRAAPRLVEDLKTPSSLRFRVVSALVRLGRPGEARALVSSSDLDVRDGAACTLLSTPPRG
ncbi:MAG: HEAT repeat domain-containing protein [Polyangiales bacterium]